MKKYARLIARVGANVQKGQGVMLYAETAQAPFAALVAEACYKAGAKWVEVNWSYQPLTKLDYRYQKLETLCSVPKYKEEKFKMYASELPCMIHILSEDPDGLAGIDQEKLQKAGIARHKVLKPYNDAMENRYQWTIAAVPSPEWAQKVFPGETKARAVAKLWDAILATVRVSADNDPVAAWQAHNETFAKNAKALNDAKFDTLEYKSANGTDFRVTLNPRGVWKGGCDKTLAGVQHNPNLPTEEIFTTPLKGKAEGRLVSTKPLSYQGQLIEDFSIDFKDGKAVSWRAAKNESLLGQMLSMDEGAAYLGELALVPVESPVNRTGILFYNTLFDENASCHVALGRGFADCLEGFETMSKQEQTDAGVNDSIIHVDFMVGTDDLSIVGYKDGKAGPLYEKAACAAFVLRAAVAVCPRRLRLPHAGGRRRFHTVCKQKRRSRGGLRPVAELRGVLRRLPRRSRRHGRRRIGARRSCAGHARGAAAFPPRPARFWRAHLPHLRHRRGRRVRLRPV